MAEHVTVNDDLTTTVRLEKPIKHREQEVSELRFPAEATVMHLEATDKAEGDIQKAVFLMAELTGASKHVIRQLSMPDFNRAAEVMNVLVGKDQGTGGTL